MNQTHKTLADDLLEVYICPIYVSSGAARLQEEAQGTICDTCVPVSRQPRKLHDVYNGE
jgi:hypothetical protein